MSSQVVKKEAPTEVSREQIQSIIELTRRVPTGENCQPWSFRWNGKTLSVFHDAERSRNLINHNEYVSYFSLGFLFENIQIAASMEKLNARFSWNIDRKTDPRRWAEIEFEHRSQPIDDLVHVLDRRFTDRQLFKKGSLNDVVFSKLQDDARQFPNCKIYLKDKPTKNFLAYARKAESFFWTNRPFHSDYTRWLRLRKREVLSTRDGLPWRSLGVNYLVSRILLICKPYPIQSLFNKIGFVAVTRKLVRQQAFSSAALCCITVNKSNIDNLIEAGRLGMRLWLRLNQHNYGFHPWSPSALFAHFSAIGVAGEIYPSLTELGRQGEIEMREYFGYGKDEIPMWLFRTGITSGFPKESTTLRLHTTELLKFDDQI